MPDREKVIKEYEEFVDKYECFSSSDDYILEMHKAVLALLKEQEAVKPKTGHWIYKKYDDMFMCSCCEKYSIRNDYPYCHWCGAKMDMDDEVDWR